MSPVSPSLISQISFTLLSDELFLTRQKKNVLVSPLITDFLVTGLRSLRTQSPRAREPGLFIKHNYSSSLCAYFV